MIHDISPSFIYANCYIKFEQSNLALERAEKKKVEKEEEYTDDNVIDSPVTDLIIREHMLPPAVFDQAVFDFLRENVCGYVG